MKSLNPYLFILFLTLSISCSTISTSKTKAQVPPVRKVAVLNFDMNNANWGAEFSDSFVHRLLKYSRWEIIEREQIFKILNEQKLSRSGVIDTETSTKIGRILGVDAIIVGRGTALNYVSVDKQPINYLVDTFSMKVVLVESGSILLQSRKSPGTDWTPFRIAKYLLGLSLIWSKEDIFIESCAYDSVADRMSQLIAENVK
ncbi:CsgG/HfaB family protein [Leptospira sp. GIMC2001]|uniref:CsgG/HfaB family protein n=1 Tax=Leptospira sp. GIMC2001 TaxID=1513297 RepID=UPI00234A5AAA|nr:CsgG/HfaB family protein [Leptospira sp. GIMC2001]WCL47703.1 curli assembly protein CsgG [Leptospira sp. GIMC2001]